MFFFSEGFTFRNFLADAFAVFMFVLWFWLLIIVIGDLFRRHDISGWGKAIWVIALIVCLLWRICGRFSPWLIQPWFGFVFVVEAVGMWATLLRCPHVHSLRAYWPPVLHSLRKRKNFRQVVSKERC